MNSLPLQPLKAPSDFQQRPRNKHAKSRKSSSLAALLKPVFTNLKWVGAISAISSLLWIGQSAAIAIGISGLISDSADAFLPWSSAVVFALLGIVRGLLNWKADEMAFNISDNIIARERQKIVAFEALRSPADNAGLSSGAVAALITEKLNALQPYIARYWPAQFRVSIIPLAFILVIFPFSWVAALILLISGPLIPVFMALVGGSAQTASQKHMQEVGTINSLLVDRLSALLDIRLLDASARTIEQFQQAADRLATQTMRVLKIAFLSSTVLELFSAIGVAMIAVYVGFSLLGQIQFGAYSQPLTITEGIFILMLAPEFFQPLRDLGAAWHDRAAAQAVADEIAEYCAHDANRILGTGGTAPSNFTTSTIIASNLSYITSNKFRIQYPDFTINSGSTVALVGKSGAGKSTLLALLAGLLPASSGTIKIDNQVLSHENADQWRANVGWVSQSPHFTNNTLLNNIAVSGSTGNEQQIHMAIQSSFASDVIERLPLGLNTHLSESGAGVSGGEARRLTLARAIYANPTIILADEPTADLDAQTANQVIDSLLTLASSGVTLVVATHDDRVIEKMQSVIDLDGTQ